MATVSDDGTQFDGHLVHEVHQTDRMTRELAKRVHRVRRTDTDVALVGPNVLALGVFVVQIIRHHVEVLYTTTLVVRSMLSFGLLSLFVSTGDPFFAAVLAVVLIWVALTGTSYLLDRRDAMGRPATA